MGWKKDWDEKSFFCHSNRRKSDCSHHQNKLLGSFTKSCSSTSFYLQVNVPQMKSVDLNTCLDRMNCYRIVSVKMRQRNLGQEEKHEEVRLSGEQRSLTKGYYYKPAGGFVILQALKYCDIWKFSSYSNWVARLSMQSLRARKVTVKSDPKNERAKWCH